MGDRPLIPESGNFFPSDDRPSLDDGTGKLSRSGSTSSILGI
jgi:hypothetical protein